MTSPAVPRRDPLSEVLLRPTTVTAPAHVVIPQALDVARMYDAAPVPSSARPGAAMARSRAAILAGAYKSVEVSGTRITMAQVAAAAGVAKATLYNHFRTRDEVLAALLTAEVDRAIEQLEHLELHEALCRAAALISEHPLLESLGGEPQILSSLSHIDVRVGGWRQIAEAVDALLARHGLRGTPTILRWLSSFVLSPADSADIALDVQVLMAGLPARR
jgi:AcrR family transcriptional regulator